jgi:hypothetical protein
MDPMFTRHLQQIKLEGRGSWLVNANVALLRAATEAVLGPDFALAGRPVSA